MSGPRSRPRRTVLFVSIAVALVMMVFVAVLASRSVQPGTVAASPLVGQRAPSISGVNILTGRMTSLAAERGHFVVVTFFASWCAPCSTETPQLIAFLFAERSIHASVLGVTYNDSRGNAVDFLRRFGASWPAVVDPSGTVAAEYGVSDPPESFVVAPNGRVLAKITGGVTENQLLQVIGLAGPS